MSLLVPTQFLRRALRGASSGIRLTLVITSSFLIVGCEKARLDEQVRELCAKDGGIKVYEIVKLPSDQFDQWGAVKFFRPTQGENALGQSYIFKEERHYYRKGDPEMSRVRYFVIRRSDGKLLGETVLYGRGGGDTWIPLPLHGSSFFCPDPNQSGDIALLKQIFVVSGDKK